MDDDKQSDLCTACGARSFRYTKSGECKPLLMFQASDLTDIVRGWWAHPIISKLLRYGYEYKRDDIYSRDVPDGKLYKHYMNILGHDVHNLLWACVTD